jgi:hypothetical protein
MAHAPEEPHKFQTELDWLLERLIEEEVAAQATQN